MAVKFKQTTSAVITDFANVKFENVKNPFSSTCPFKDEQTVEFEGFVEVAWSHEKWGNGKYLALKFKGVKDVLALTALLKEVNGFASLDLSDTSLKEFRNEGGLAEVMRQHGAFDAELLNKIKEFFNTQRKIKLTKYYTNLGAGRKTCNLINIIQLGLRFVRCAVNNGHFYY